jgi:hypothetical protein
MWNDERILLEAKKFFQSGLFYVVLGSLFLVVGYQLTTDSSTHSAFVFIIVILGVALVLYGTGTNASGENTTGSIKVAIAGGAGVMALVLGLGVVNQHEGLVQVFKHQRDYGVIDLSIAPENGVPIDLSKYDVQARLGGLVPLPLFYDAQRIRIFAPIPNDKDVDTEISLSFSSKPGSGSNYLRIDDLPINWKAKEVKDSTGFANEKIKFVRRTIDARAPRAIAVRPVADSGTRASLPKVPVNPR